MERAIPKAPEKGTQLGDYAPWLLTLIAMAMGVVAYAHATFVTIREVEYIRSDLREIKEILLDKGAHSKAKTRSSNKDT